MFTKVDLPLSILDMRVLAVGTAPMSIREVRSWHRGRLRIGHEGQADEVSEDVYEV
jgi:hypothetical protein